MEQAEINLKRKRRLLEHRMRIYTVSQLNKANVNLHEAVIKEIQDLLTDLILTIEEHIDEFSTHLGQERITQLNAEVSTLERNFLVYTDSFVPNLTDLRQNPSINNPALQEVPSLSHLALSDSFQVRQNAAKRKVKARLEAVMEDLVKLSKKACEVEDWASASDLSVGRAMKDNEKLRNEYIRINTARRDIDELMAEFDLEEARDGLSVQECDLKLYEVREEVEQTVKAVVEKDNLRELYSLDEAKVDKVKLPTFSGKESEDYEKFKSDFLKGLAQNRVTQAEKLALRRS